MLRNYFFIALLLALATAQDGSDAELELEENFQETIIFLKKETFPGQNVFIRGGVGNGKGCAPDENPENDPCAIPINHLELDMDSETPLRDEWAESDLFLRWGENKVNENMTVPGTPAQWTTSEEGEDYFHSLNTYGEHYWMVHFDMDCSKLDNGFFDFKGYLDGQWENDINQGACGGDAAETPSYTSSNHIARCGYVNVFEWNQPQCTIDSIF
ncbi:alpha-amylase [Elysia marginata]|uniref:Alpha-amylase n=1 Tax=Elysia marginata TaxID=1093978 RepID=A0AAV4H4J3_9GAST|nr:alpha-amylase [Elysia marginata]